jgi:hypothetical protein
MRTLCSSLLVSLAPMISLALVSGCAIEEEESLPTAVELELGADQETRRVEATGADEDLSSVPPYGSGEGQDQLGPEAAACTHFTYETTVQLCAWEGTNYDHCDTIIDPGIRLGGIGGSRPNGWTPVDVYWDGSSWEDLLEGEDDVHDFVRTSGLDYIGCI